ncbi:MAG: choice-of-anchor M domain-containing protein [Verrucomicrobia bacterium]|nr:choice-of-anchor M domain-containing protein [Verrucomicrobiota bacterium]MCH8510669.1 choice-of-anchor M domain-containing protein [Kiritimatiellia bacterium]
MKRITFILPFICLLSVTLHAQWDYRAYTDGHVDIGPRLEEGQLKGFWKNDGATIDGQISAPDFPAHGVRALAIFDENTPPLNRPAGSQWDFLGVAPGEPIYILPSSGTPNTVPYLGFSTEDPSLGSYDEVHVTLQSMTGPDGGVFSLYVFSISTGTSNVYMNTSENDYPAGTLELDVGDHEHYNWAFSKLGTYDLTFLFEILKNGEIIHAGTDTFRVQVTEGGGYTDYEQWRITHFRPEEIPDDAIAGPEADPHNLGIRNEQVYAFGFDPSIELLQLSHEGESVPGIRFHQRTGSEDLNISVQTATDLIEDDWTNAAAVLEEQNRIFHDPGLERRIYRLQTPPAGTTFFRAHAESVTPEN